MSDPKRIADLGFTRILDRLDEAKEHNVALLEQREAAYQKLRSERVEQERQRKECAAQEYEKAIAKAKKALLAGEVVANPQINGKSLVLQLFREHNNSNLTYDCPCTQPFVKLHTAKTRAFVGQSNVKLLY